MTPVQVGLYLPVHSWKLCVLMSALRGSGLGRLFTVGPISFVVIVFCLKLLSSFYSLRCFYVRYVH